MYTMYFGEFSTTSGNFWHTNSIHTMTNKHAINSIHITNSAVSMSSRTQLVCVVSRYWKSGQPDHGGTNNEEDCVEVYHRDGVLANWNDAPCNHMLRWICEKLQKQLHIGQIHILFKCVYYIIIYNCLLYINIFPKIV